LLSVLVRLRRGPSAKRRPELQNPVRLAATYRKISDGNSGHHASAGDRFKTQTLLSSFQTPGVPTFFILFGGLSASHSLPLCGSDAAVVVPNDFLLKPNGTRRAFPRHLAVSSSIPERRKGGCRLARAAFAYALKAAVLRRLPSVFAFEVNKPPASKKT
jgi:hypothetical protein